MILAFGVILLWFRNPHLTNALYSRCPAEGYRSLQECGWYDRVEYHLHKCEMHYLVVSQHYIVNVDKKWMEYNREEDEHCT